MKNKIKEFMLVVSSIFVFTYLLNFLWESFHSVFLYKGHNFNAIKYVPMIGKVSAIDGILVLGIYCSVALLCGNFFWLRKADRKQTFTFIVLGLIIAAFIEYRGVFLLDKWGYNLIMPTIFGIGLSPLVQLSITGILSLWTTKKLIYEKGIYYGR